MLLRLEEKESIGLITENPETIKRREQVYKNIEVHICEKFEPILPIIEDSMYAGAMCSNGEENQTLKRKEKY